MLSDVLGQRGSQGWFFGCVFGGGPCWISWLLFQGGHSDEAWERGVLQQLDGCCGRGGILVTSQVLPPHLPHQILWVGSAAPLWGTPLVFCCQKRGSFGKAHTVPSCGGRSGDALIYTFISSLCPWSSAEQTERLEL